MDKYKGALDYLEGNHRGACIAGTELGISLSLGLAFALLSTKAQRRQRALFIVNCFSIACVITTSIVKLRKTSLIIPDRLVGGVGVEIARLDT